MTMTRTAKQVQTDIMSMLNGSDLVSGINGSVYRNGYRPRDSRAEDIIVTFTTGLPDEIETGIVTLNIYVPDIDPYGNGVLVEDGARTDEIERLAQKWVDSLSASMSDYIFKLQQTIYTETEPDIHQHFVVVKLKYSLYDR